MHGFMRYNDIVVVVGGQADIRREDLPTGQGHDGRCVCFLCASPTLAPLLVVHESAGDKFILFLSASGKRSIEEACRDAPAC